MLDIKVRSMWTEIDTGDKQFIVLNDEAIEQQDNLMQLIKMLMELR